MPYVWVEPKELLKEGDVTVYHCYTDGSVAATFWYTTDPTDSDLDYDPGQETQFDVRDLPGCGRDVNDPKNHPEIIRSAIRAGLTPNRNRSYIVVVRELAAELVYYRLSAFSSDEALSLQAKGGGVEISRERSVPPSHQVETVYRDDGSDENLEDTK